jgi:CDP-paratose 2-epimerase
MTSYLITGGCGFLGSNLAAKLIQSKEKVTIVDDMSRSGAQVNLKWLRSKGAFTFAQTNVSDKIPLDSLISKTKPDVIFHLAGQVAMTTSISNPFKDFEINAIGSLNILEAVRNHCPDTTIIYASTNKVYGDLHSVKLKEGPTRYVSPSHPQGVTEKEPLNFCTPYGCSKGTADQYMLDYARVFGIKTLVFRHSTIYGGRQFATFDQGWVGWFCQQAKLFQKDPHRSAFSISGNGKQVRDLLYVDDAVDLYIKASLSSSDVRGEAFNIGGGAKNSCSLLELISRLEDLAECPLEYFMTDWRPHDQKYFVADTGKAETLLNWKPSTCIDSGLLQIFNWVGQQPN